MFEQVYNPIYKFALNAMRFTKGCKKIFHRFEQIILKALQS